MLLPWIWRGEESSHWGEWSSHIRSNLGRSWTNDRAGGSGMSTAEYLTRRWASWSEQTSACPVLGLDICPSFKSAGAPASLRHDIVSRDWMDSVENSGLWSWMIDWSEETTLPSLWVYCENSPRTDWEIFCGRMIGRGLSIRVGITALGRSLPGRLPLAWRIGIHSVRCEAKWGNKKNEPIPKVM